MVLTAALIRVSKTSRTRRCLDSTRSCHGPDQRLLHPTFTSFLHDVSFTLPVDPAEFHLLLLLSGPTLPDLPAQLYTQAPASEEADGEPFVFFCIECVIFTHPVPNYFPKPSVSFKVALEGHGLTNNHRRQRLDGNSQISCKTKKKSK